MKYHSQYDQDKFLDKVVFNGKRNGFFIDIGAHDGVTISNSLFFEQTKQWEGVCVEPNPQVYEKLVKNRKSVNLNICIGNTNKTVSFTKIEGYSEMLSGITESYDPRHLKRIQSEIEAKGGKIENIEVEMKSLDTIDTIQSKIIDFVSLDTEGNEYDILKSIDFKVLNIKAFVVENNYNDNQISDLLINNGYVHLFKLKGDDIFIAKEMHTFPLKLRVLNWKIKLLLKRICKRV